MNADNGTTQTTKPATEGSPQMTIELESLSGLNLESACAFANAIDTLNRVVSSLIFQAGNKEVCFYLFEIEHFFMMLHNRLVEVVEERNPEGVDEIALRFWTTLQHRVASVFHLEGEASIADISVLAAIAARDIGEAKRKARSQARADATGKA